MRPSMWSPPVPAEQPRGEVVEAAVERYARVAGEILDWRERAEERWGFEETTRKVMGD